MFGNYVAVGASIEDEARISNHATASTGQDLARIQAIGRPHTAERQGDQADVGCMRNYGVAVGRNVAVYLDSVINGYLRPNDIVVGSAATSYGYVLVLQIAVQSAANHVSGLAEMSDPDGTSHEMAIIRGR